MDLFFYDVDADYVKYLKTTETAKRGFTRVPDVEYENERKMVCGVVLEMNGYKYYVPVSSYKKKQPNNLLIRLEDDTFNQVKGSLRFNYMFPVDDRYISKRDFNKETPGRKEFLRRQWVFCNSITDDIKEMAEETYNGVISSKDSALVNASCDFKLLEDAAKNYKPDNQNQYIYIVNSNCHKGNEGAHMYECLFMFNNKKSPPLPVEGYTFNPTISIPHIGQRYTINPTISIPPIGLWKTFNLTILNALSYVYIPLSQDAGNPYAALSIRFINLLA